MPEQAALVTKIKAERGGRLLNLYATLLNSPPVCEGWLNLFTGIRQKGTISDRHRELATMRVAVINGAQYEYLAHVPFALKAGINQKQLDDLPFWRDSKAYEPNDRAVLEYTDTMTKNIQVPNDVFEPLRKFLDNRQILELTTTIAGYN
ncbi:MAG: carboxymuconolactone decarboxylase family protein, partial [Burkholderiales bacterium]